MEEGLLRWPKLPLRIAKSKPRGYTAQPRGFGITRPAGLRHQNHYPLHPEKVLRVHM